MAKFSLVCQSLFWAHGHNCSKGHVFFKKEKLSRTKCERACLSRVLKGLGKQTKQALDLTKTSTGLLL